MIRPLGAGMPGGVPAHSAGNKIRAAGAPSSISTATSSNSNPTSTSTGTATSSNPAGSGIAAGSRDISSSQGSGALLLPSIQGPSSISSPASGATEPSAAHPGDDDPRASKFAIVAKFNPDKTYLVDMIK